MSLHLQLLDAEAARAGDAAAVAAGDTWSGLMERAAGHLARAVVGVAGRGYGCKVTIVVGSGNNGGDGWAAARRLRDEHGAQAWVIAPKGLDTPGSDEAVANRRRWIDTGGRTSGPGGRTSTASDGRTSTASDGCDDLEVALAWCDVAVDALLGTGISGAPRGVLGEAARALVRAHHRGVPVVACDVPSGVSSDDGSAPDGAVRAHTTVTFGGCKRGLVLHPGAAHAGRIVVAGLGAAYDPGEQRWAALTPAGAAPPRYGPATDKRARGTVLAVAGALGTSGAAALTATGALTAGAGLVTVATPHGIRAEVAGHHPAAMVIGVPGDDVGAIDASAVHALPPLDDIDTVVAGPGLGHGEGTAAVVTHLRRHARRLVLDADAINVHRDDPAALCDHEGTLVLTPHERELARIGGGEDGRDAWANRAERVPRLAAAYDAIIVAKGPGTIVAAPDGRVWVTPVGGPSAGSGGTGDVLAGVIAAALAAADDDLPLAVARAVWWHAAAGSLAGADRAGRATAIDLLAALPGVLGTLAAQAVPMGAVPPVVVPPGAIPTGAIPTGAVPTGAIPTGAAHPLTAWPVPWDAWREVR